jgi:membrane fusion protein, multidrug efflux system
VSDNTDTPAATAAPINGSYSKRRRILLTLMGIFLAGGAIWGSLEYFVFALREKTDDAYVTGNQVRISSQLAGTVVEVFVRNTSRVKAGQLLLAIDPTDSQQSLDRAGATLAQTVRQVRSQQAQSSQFDATITARQLELRRTEQDLSEREPLLAEQAVAGEEVRHARDAVALARAQLTQAEQQAQSARALVDDVPLIENPAVLAAAASYREAWLALQRTRIVSPINGFVAQRSVQLGQRIAPGEPLMTIIPLQDVWVEANFKEGQLRHLRIGQPARIVTDVYGSSIVFHGRVIGLSAGTGSAFSLLPPQNASGNWIKVVQRVPVKIALQPEELAKHPLRIGLSTTTSVDTQDRSGTVLAAESAVEIHENTASYAQDMVAAKAAADAIIRANAGRR